MTQAESISGFAEKPLGFYDTSHIVRYTFTGLYILYIRKSCLWHLDGYTKPDRLQGSTFID